MKTTAQIVRSYVGSGLPARMVRERIQARLIENWDERRAAERRKFAAGLDRVPKDQFMRIMRNYDRRTEELRAEELERIDEEHAYGGDEA